MEGYWPMIPPQPPPTENIRTYSPENYEQNKQQQDEMSQQRIWKQMVLDINCMCEKLQQYVEDKIECENKQLKYEEHFKKEYLKDEK